jgi:hypothetical protein
MPVTEAFLKERTLLAKPEFYKFLLKTADYSLKFKDNYSLGDCRYTFFAHFFELNGWLMMQLDQFLGLLDSKEQIKFNDKVLDAKHRSTFLDQFDTINRANYCTTGIFYTEQLLKSINVKIGKHLSRDGYWNITRDLLFYLDPSLTESLTKSLKKGNYIKMKNEIIKNDKNHLILNTPAQIRNTLHNNGYTNKDFDIIVNNKLISVKKDKQLVGTGWITLCKVFYDLIELLLVILHNPKIKRIKHIPELYKSEQGT